MNDIKGIGDKLDKLRDDTAKRMEKELGADYRGFGMGRGGYGYGDCGFCGGYDGPRHGGGRHHMGRW